MTYSEKRCPMSTLAYAALTTKREQGPPGTTTSQSPPGVNTYVDALAALVPAEVLMLHGMILTVTTKTVDAKTEVTAKSTLSWAFVCLILLSIILYVVPRVLVTRQWVGLDYFRVAIPPLAFVGWTMLQKATAFDAVAPGLTEAPRTVIALFLAVVLGLAASVLATKADQRKQAGKSNLSPVIDNPVE
jgi:hypothetical protein